ncbi:NAD(P)H-binding protein [Micrococcaceae bacterium Sec5.7]
MILVTGASGQLAQAILQHLSQAGCEAIGGTRRPGDDPHLRLLDFDDPATLNFGDVDTLVIVSAGTAEDDVVVARHENVIAAAERGNVQHIIYTSLADGGDHLGFALAHRWTEQRLKRCTIPWTILRNGLYAELIGQLLAPESGAITAPFGHGRVAAIARQDLADAASLVAQDPQPHAGRTYNLVGTRAISALEVADEVGAIYRPGTLGDLRRSLNTAGLLPFQPAMLLSIHAAVAHGFLDGTTDDIAQLLGRAPRDPLTVAAAVAQGAGSR